MKIYDMKDSDWKFASEIATKAPEIRKFFITFESNGVCRTIDGRKKGTYVNGKCDEYSQVVCQ